jgi:hypothetical protein
MVLATILQAVGAAFVLYNVATLAIFLYNTFLIKNDLKKYKGAGRRGAAWAMVTGSSDGIGKGFAEVSTSRKHR